MIDRAHKRVLLIQMPFFAVDTPSISLALVKAALERSGFECDLQYFNVEFAKRLGIDGYSWIGARSPIYLLFGDLIFAPSLHDSHISVERLRELVAPLGPPGVSAVPDEIIDAYSELVQAARDFLYDKLRATAWSEYGLVGFGTMFQIGPALAMARLIKTFVDDPPPVILGGSNCEGEMGEYLHRSFPWIDYVCRGEGEGLIVDLAQHLSDGSVPLDGISGLVWRDHGRTCCNGSKGSLVPFAGKSQSTADREFELDVLPIPTYDDWIGQVDGFLEPDRRKLPIETGRGCWYGEKQHCTFCGLNKESIAFRRKSAERALEEYRGLMAYGITQLHSVDDILDYRYFKTLLPELAKLKHGAQIFSEIKSNLTHEQVRLLKDSGIVWIQPGIESLSTPVLELMKKGVTAMLNIRLLRYAAEFAIGAAWNLLYGFPRENPDDFQKMAELLPALSHLQPPHFEPGPARIHRFSPLYLNWKAEGFTDVNPAPAYYEIYPFERDVVVRMAYYFEHRYGRLPDPDSYIQPLYAAVKGWHDEVGTAAFVRLLRGDALHLLDTRRIAAKRNATLEGFSRDVFLACEHGASLGAIAQTVRRSPDDVQSMLESFIARRWVLHVDDKFLSLAVPVDKHVPSHIPLALAEGGVLERYCAQMAGNREGFTVAPPSFETLRARAAFR